MPRPRKPTNILELSGAFKHNPDRARPNEPEATSPIGEPPESLPDDVRACWVEIVSLCHPGVLSSADRLVVEHCARVLARLRGADWDCDPALMVRFERALSALGMTPADRSRVQVSKPKKGDDPLAEFRRKQA